MRLALALLAFSTATSACAEDAAYCAQWATDTLAVGKILTGQEADNGKLVALLALCLGREAEPAYTVDTTPKPKPVAKAKPAKAKPAWVRECEKYVSWRAKDQTVITLTSDPKRVPCPAKP